MYRVRIPALVASASLSTLCVLSTVPAAAQALIGPNPYAAAAATSQQPTRYAAAQPQMGGGFIEFLFGGGRRRSQERDYQSDPRFAPQASLQYGPGPGDPSHPMTDPRFMKQTVPYTGKEAPGTIVINTNDKLLYLVQDNGTAIRYGVGVGRPGFLWAGTKSITQKREWPDWTPPPEMLQRRPDLPRHMEGGPENPLGARAMYLGSSLYRIHGSNEPWTIGTNVSSGCIRMRNEDVIDLYSRVRVGTKVVVM
jgi:lipoprotein-anchoring transpeptidase ErfK/SrfK